MLKHEDNERLVRVGPNTPGGALFRRYWQPFALASELAEKDGEPLRVRLLGEDLLAFRDSDGNIGLVDAYCPHRRAPLFFGRNEECGIRCVYHGWKFNVSGDCVDMPSEPEGSPMKATIKLQSYPTAERGGILWAYLGPRDTMPALPDYEWTRAPATHCHVSKTYEECNYLQALEGGLDTAHSSFLHNNSLGDKSDFRQRDGAPRIEVERTKYGYTYVSTRNVGAEGQYVRIYQYLMPAQQLRADVARAQKRNEVPTIHGHIWVPIDDEQTFVYNLMYSYDTSDEGKITPEFAEHFESFSGRGVDDHIPGTFRLKRNKSNDYLIDRSVQRTKTFTGIKGLNTQDMALQEGMGPIVDRSKEHLGTSDRAIVQMRRLLLEATQDVEKGESPRGTDPADYRGVRPCDGLVQPGDDWRKSLAADTVARW